VNSSSCVFIFTCCRNGCNHCRCGQSGLFNQYFVSSPITPCLKPCSCKATGLATVLTAELGLVEVVLATPVPAVAVAVVVTEAAVATVVAVEAEGSASNAGKMVCTLCLVSSHKMRPLVGIMHTHSLSVSQGTGQEIAPTVTIMAVLAPPVSAVAVVVVTAAVATAVAVEVEESASNAGKMVCTHKCTMLHLSLRIRCALWLVLCTHALCLTPRALGKKLSQQ
jgi:hypothetical protein